MKGTLPGKTRIIAGKYRHRYIQIPNGVVSRPTLNRIKEAFFNSLESQLKYSTYTFYDLFAGSGSMSFEALSRGFSKVYALENSPLSFASLKKNASLFSDPNFHFFDLDSVEWLKNQKLKTPCVIYLDPPYRSKLIEEILHLLSVRDQFTNQDLLIFETNQNLSIPPYFEETKLKKYGKIQLHYLKKAKISYE